VSRLRVSGFRRYATLVVGVLSLVGASVSGVSAQTSNLPPTSQPGGPVEAPPAPVTPVPQGPVLRVASPTDPVLVDDPVAYWLLDDPAGSPAVDSVRSPRVRHDGTYSGNVVASVDSPRQGLNGSRKFGGGSCDGVIVDPSVTQVTGDMSVEGWVKTTSSSGVLFRWRWYGYLLRVSGGKATFESSNRNGSGFVGGSVVAGNKVVNDGEWHHLAAVRTGDSPAKLQVFVDGVLDGSVTVPTSSTTTFYGSPLEAAIGRDGFACDGAIPSMNGNLAAVAVFDRALTGAQVAAHADPCGGFDRAGCFAPELRFHPQEDYYPIDVDQWLSNTELKWAANGFCRDKVVSKNINGSNLTNGTFTRAEVVRSGVGWRNCTQSSSGRRYPTTEFTRPFQANSARNGEPRACAKVANAQGAFVVPTAANGLVCPATHQTAAAKYLTEDEGFFLNNVGPGQTGPNTNAPVYIEEWPDRISYWFFYPQDPKGFFPHEGDWENIEVEFEENTKIPKKVIYVAHACRTNSATDSDREFSWANTPKTLGTHPIVYPSRDTHASWPRDNVQAFPTTQLLDPRVCGQRAVGASDSTGFTPASSVLQSWNNVLAAPAQCWYGFGGAWGATGLGIDTSLGAIPVDQRSAKTGPQGLPFADASGQTRIPKSAQCRSSAGGKVTVSPSTSSTDPTAYAWGATVQGSATEGTPGTTYTVALETIPTTVTTGTVDNTGSTSFTFPIPIGTAPSEHDLVMRDTTTGEELFRTNLSVDPPVECISTAPTPIDDVDDDLVKDICDPNILDGPAADLDNDGIKNLADNCPTVSNPTQVVKYQRSDGAACDERENFNPVPLQQPVTVVRSGECALCALDPTGTNVLNGTSTLSGQNRSIGINGNLQAVGPARATATGYQASIRIGGNLTKTGQPVVEPVTTGTVLDPFASTPIPAVSAGGPNVGSVILQPGATLPTGTYGSIVISGAGIRTLNPGKYGSLTINGQATVKLNPGTYVFTGTANINAASLSGTDITLMFTCGTPSTPSACNTSAIGGSFISNAATINLTRNDPNPVVFYDRNNNAQLTLNASTIQAGSIYAKSSRLTLNATTVTGQNAAKIVTRTFTLNGISTLTVRAPGIS
jgi:hypothetical protein